MRITHDEHGELIDYGDLAQVTEVCATLARSLYAVWARHPHLPLPEGVAAFVVPDDAADLD